MNNKKNIILALLMTCGVAHANQATVVDAKLEQQGGVWTVNVTLKHADTGWDHYADLASENEFPGETQPKQSGVVSCLNAGLDLFPDPPKGPMIDIGCVYRVLYCPEALQLTNEL